MYSSIFDYFPDWVDSLPKDQRMTAIELFVDFGKFIDKIQKEKNEENIYD